MTSEEREAVTALIECMSQIKCAKNNIRLFSNVKEVVRVSNKLINNYQNIIENVRAEFPDLTERVLNAKVEVSLSD